MLMRCIRWWEVNNKLAEIVGEEMKNINIYLKIIDSLLKSTIDAYRTDDTPYYENVYLEINKIINFIRKTEYGHIFKFSELKYSYPASSSDLMIAISTLRQMKAFLESVTGEDTEKVKKFLETLKDMQKKLVVYVDNRNH